MTRQIIGYARHVSTDSHVYTTSFLSIEQVTERWPQVAVYVLGCCTEIQITMDYITHVSSGTP